MQRFDRRHTVATPTSSEEGPARGAGKGSSKPCWEKTSQRSEWGAPSQLDQRNWEGRLVLLHVPLRDVELRGRMRSGRAPGGDPQRRERCRDRRVAARCREGRVPRGTCRTLGTGIGGGLILDGRPFRGPFGRGAELGHMVLDYVCPRCKGDCTGHGHFEALRSGVSGKRARPGALRRARRRRRLVQRVP